MSMNSASDLTQWDRVASCFCSDKTEHSGYTPGQDNYEAVWPVLYQVIQGQSGWAKSIGQACDFGCGTGLFSKKLVQTGFHVFACDPSKEMIRHANKESKDNVVYELGGIDCVQRHAPFQLIISVMVFQFIPDINSVIQKLTSCLDQNGIMFFAVHHINYVYECMKHEVKFRGIKDSQSPVTGEILIDNMWIKTYIRAPDWYDSILSSAGLIQLGHSLQGNTPPDGISKKPGLNWDTSKYYIAWYRKKPK